MHGTKRVMCTSPNLNRHLQPIERYWPVVPHTESFSSYFNLSSSHPVLFPLVQLAKNHQSHLIHSPFTALTSDFVQGIRTHRFHKLAHRTAGASSDLAYWLCLPSIPIPTSSLGR